DAALRRQDFATAAALIGKLAHDDDPRARSLRYRWLFVRDDAATVDSLTQRALAGGDAGHAPELRAAARLAYDQPDSAPSGSRPARALAACANEAGAFGRRERSDAHVAHALVLQRRRQWDASLAELRTALDEQATARALSALAETLVRLGRT